MKPGVGYMMLRHSSTEASFVYPFYEPGSTFIDEWSFANGTNKSAHLRSTMSLSAIIEGFEPLEGDKLVAYSGEKQCGVANALSDEVIYVSIEGETNKSLWFAIERNGEIVASTDEQMLFRANSVVGSPDEPAVISFINTDCDDGYWYTIGGMQWKTKPTERGLYIHNGKKVLIK
jgi:hypothetical protein